MDLHTTIAGILLKNPLMPASGPLTGDAEKMLAIGAQGVGAMVGKTISRQGARVPRPCIYGERDALMNAELWSEYGPEQWVKDFLPAYKAGDPARPLFLSIGYSVEDVTELLPKLNPFADAYEISTHYVGKDLEHIARTVRAVRDGTDKPFFFKLSPHIPDVVGFAQMVRENGGAGVVAINSLGPTLKIDLARRAIRFGNTEGEVWTSGPVIKPMALALVHKVKKALPDCTIIGVGGVAAAEDVLEFLLAGADGVQMLSGAMLKGRDLYGKILDALPAALESYGFSSVQDVIHTRLKPYTPRYEKRTPTVSAADCVRCGACAQKCPYFAIYMNGTAEINKDKCFGCGLCQSICPKGAIHGVFDVMEGK